jgi:hypothetical protein
MYFILQRGKIQIWKAICATNQGLHLRSAQLPKNIVLLTMKGYHETNFHFTGFKKKIHFTYPGFALLHSHNTSAANFRLDIKSIFCG